MQTVYAHTVEGLFFKAVRTRIGPGLKDRLKPLGIDLDGKPADVPREKWAEALRVTATELFPNPKIEESYRLLGRALIDGYANTLIGKSVISVLRLLGPARAVSRLEKTLRSGNNDIEARIEQKGPAEFDGWINECNGNPGYVVGVLEAALESSGAKNVKILVSDFDGHSAKLNLSWTEA
jgi:uncharacterized protein (TIGR02265 family)